MCNCKCKDLWDYIDWKRVLKEENLDDDFIIKYLDTFFKFKLIQMLLQYQNCSVELLKLLDAKDMLNDDDRFYYRNVL